MTVSSKNWQCSWENVDLSCSKKSAAIFLGEKKHSACGNVVRHVGLPNIWGHLFLTKKKKTKNVRGNGWQTCGASNKSQGLQGSTFPPHPQAPRLIKRLIKPLDLGVGGKVSPETVSSRKLNGCNTCAIKQHLGKVSNIKSTGSLTLCPRS